MKYIYLSIFIIFMLIHLYASYKNANNLRKITKGFIMLSLFGFYHTSVATVSWLVVVAILLSWAGDMLLMIRGLKGFIPGGIAFLGSHLFYIFAFNELFNINNIKIIYIIGIILAYLIATMIIFYKLKPHLKTILMIPMILYLVVNGLMNSFAWFRMIGGFNFASLITVVGAILFFISDAALFFVRFNKESKMKSHFLVMLTYSLSEFLIILGFILC